MLRSVKALEQRRGASEPIAQARAACQAAEGRSPFRQAAAAADGKAIVGRFEIVARRHHWGGFNPKPPSSFKYLER